MLLVLEGHPVSSKNPPKFQGWDKRVAGRNQREQSPLRCGAIDSPSSKFMMSFYQKMLKMSGQTCYYPQTRHFQLWLVPQRFSWTFFSSGFHLIPRRQWGIALPHNQMSLSECQPGWYCLERIIYHMVCKQTSIYFNGLPLIGGEDTVHNSPIFDECQTQ